MSAALQIGPTEWIAKIAEPVVAIDGSPDAARWGALGTEGNATVFDAAGRVLLEWPAHRGGGFRLAWHPTLNLLATSGADGEARIWDPSTGKLLHSCAGGNAWVELLEWSPDGRFLAIGAGKTLTLWRPDGQQIQAWKNHRSTLAALCWRADSEKIAAACYGGVQIYDPAAGPAGELLPWKTSLLSLAWSPDQRWVVAGTQDLSVQIWPQPFKPGEELAMSGYAAKVRDLTWHHSILATGGGEDITVWDCSGAGPAGTSPITLEGQSGCITALKYQTRGPLLASGSETGCVRLWKTEFPEPQRELQLSESITSISWDRTDRSLLVGARDGMLVRLLAPAA